MDSPPFRTDHVGSLLRPHDVKAARARHQAGALSADGLREVEDEAIRRAIVRQEAIGLKSITDGEYRRAFFNFDFLEHLDGIEASDVPGGHAFKGMAARARKLEVTGKVGFTGHPMLAHFRFLKSHTRATPKWTLPNASTLHFRGGRQQVSKDVYPDMEEFYEDLGEAYRQAVRAFADAGCRYLQFDEVYLALLCDPEQRKLMAGRGDDPDAAIALYARLLNAAASGAPPGMTVAMHLCRGNYRSTFIASGGYGPIAHVLFNAINVTAYFLEYDDERSGGFEPLRLVPAGKTVVLGLVTSKSGALEKKDKIKRRIEEATRFVPLERLRLSPQCGFASTEEGNTLTEDEQWRKLELVAEVAREMWGTT